jgi:DNA-binding NtrC family response regulator
MKTLLVVDDDLDMLDYYKELLSPSYQVITALSGSEALNILKAAKVDAVLTDHVMYGMNGVQLIKEVETLDPNLPVIIISGSYVPEYEGILLLKPFNENKLLSILVEITCLKS